MPRQSASPLGRGSRVQPSIEISVEREPYALFYPAPSHVPATSLVRYASASRMGPWIVRLWGLAASASQCPRPSPVRAETQQISSGRWPAARRRAGRSRAAARPADCDCVTGVVRKVGSRSHTAPRDGQGTDRTGNGTARYCQPQAVHELRNQNAR
jgi:hypothetical protein